MILTLHMKGISQRERIDITDPIDDVMTDTKEITEITGITEEECDQTLTHKNEDLIHTGITTHEAQTGCKTETSNLT